MKIGSGALRMRRSLENRPLVVGEHGEPGLKVRGVIRPGLQFRRYPQIGAEEAAPKLGDQLFASALAAILRITTEVTTDAMLGRGPMGLMPISA